MKKWLPLIGYLVVVVLGAFIFSAWREKVEAARPATVLRYDNVVRVLMHEPNYFSLYTEQTDSKILGYQEFSDCSFTEIIADVPPGEKMWALKTEIKGTPTKWLLQIHIHSPKDINGAGWDHGKYGRGQTVPIE
ncbi:MAG: hypothetical protein WC227_00015 [Patescibacteria group bacterium]